MSHKLCVHKNHAISDGRGGRNNSDGEGGVEPHGEGEQDAEGVRLDEGGGVEGGVRGVPGGGRVQGDASSLGSTITG